VVGADGIPIEDWSDAVVFTPGGGRIGSLAGGILDARLADLAGRWSAGRVVDIEIDEVEALIAGLPAGGSARCVIVPADALPEGTIELALTRRPFTLTSWIEGDEIVEMTLQTEAPGPRDGGAPGVATETPGSTAMDGGLVTRFEAVPQLVIVGDSPVADSLGGLARAVGWRAHPLVDAASASGVIATLSPIDLVVVTGHDLELTGSALKAALESDVGYIGSLGARKMQENRADWLAYRGVTDLSRVHGPAGLDIGAETPAEIAVSIVAEAIAELAADKVDA
jgi:xanthine dehydrogenase accessory factor